MLTKSELLRRTKVSEELFQYCLDTRLIPRPDQIVWLNPPSELDCFPDYVLGDLMHLDFLKKCEVSSLWEIKTFLLRAEGIVRYEVEMTRRFGEVIHQEVHSDEEKVRQDLSRRGQELFPHQKVLSSTFRSEKVGSKIFIVLSRVVLEPKTGPFKLEMEQVSSKETQKRVTQVYKLVTGSRAR